MGAQPQTIVMVHGNAESSRAWICWMPHLVGNYRVARPDMPGFGNSTEPPGYGWSMTEIAGDLGPRAAVPWPTCPQNLNGR